MFYLVEVTENEIEKNEYQSYINKEINNGYNVNGPNNYVNHQNNYLNQPNNYEYHPNNYLNHQNYGNYAFYPIKQKDEDYLEWHFPSRKDLTLVRRGD